MARYEGHITFDKKYAMPVGEALDLNPRWKFSQITGCPLMGPDKTYCYATGYNEDALVLFGEMQGLIEYMKREYQIEPLRQKIERIIYDTKTNVDEL